MAMANGITVKSLLLDEAFFARNIMEFPEGYNRPSAPSAPLFYLVSYGMVLIFGNGEWVYRLLPLLSAIAGLILMILLLWKHYSRMAATLAIILLATSIPLIEYGGNAHPNATDFFCSALLLFITYHFTLRPSNRLWWLWIVCSIAALGLSLPAVFVVMASSVIFLFRDIWKRQYTQLWQKMKGFIPLGIILFCLVLFVYLQKSGGRDDFPYWVIHFPDNIMPWTVFKWAFANTNALLGYLFWNSEYGLIGLFLILLGTAWFVLKKQYTLCFVCWGPVLLTIGAASLEKWPYGPLRIMLFLLPLFILLIGGGLESIWQSVQSRASKMVVFMACLLLLLPQSWILTRSIAHVEDSKEAMRSLSDAIKDEIMRDDVILVYYGADVQFQYYFPEYLDSAIIEPWSHSGDDYEIEYFVESNIRDIVGRFWLIFSHSQLKEDEFMLSVAEKYGQLLQSFAFPGCSAYLFER